nr:hypothetical protein HK105_002424 [Polyrhizophydium stewartii]
MSSEPHFVGVDVGSTSARAAVVSAAGIVKGTGTCAVQVLHPRTDYWEQVRRIASSDDIWRGVCVAIRAALEASGVPASAVHGIGFDATCSLVALDGDLQPVSVSPTNDPSHNVIMWMDHRAVAEAAALSATGHPCLAATGGAISPEMSAAKICWIRKHRFNETWAKARHLIELPDFLTLRATGSLQRGRCSLVCKWAFDGSEQHSGGSRWHADFLAAGGISHDDMPDALARLGGPAGGGIDDGSARASYAGEPIGDGLTRQAAEDLGLGQAQHRIAVGGGVIDAYAGAIGTLGISINNTSPSVSDLGRRLALIGAQVKGIWGPYPGVVLPGMFCTEGGQSAAGIAIQHMISSHPRFAELGENAHDKLLAHIEQAAQDAALAHPAMLTTDLHVLPDLNGNRSPLADPHMRGMVCGLALDDSVRSLACIYLATLLGVCYGTRHIIESLNASGSHSIDTIFVSGGLAANRLFLASLADVTGMRVVVPQVSEGEAVLLGSAMCGATASVLAKADARHGESMIGDTLWSHMVSMAGFGSAVEPSHDSALIAFHSKKYAVFLRMYQDQLAYRAMMSA